MRKPGPRDLGGTEWERSSECDRNKWDRVKECGAIYVQIPMRATPLKGSDCSAKRSAIRLD